MANREVWAKLVDLNGVEANKFKPGVKYTSVGEFQESPNGWSVILEFVAPHDDGTSYWGRIRFLVDHAPHEILTTTHRFVIVEGEPVIAVFPVTKQDVPLAVRQLVE